MTNRAAIRHRSAAFEVTPVAAAHMAIRRPDDRAAAGQARGRIGSSSGICRIPSSSSGSSPYSNRHAPKGACAVRPAGARGPEAPAVISAGQVAGAPKRSPNASARPTAKCSGPNVTVNVPRGSRRGGVAQRFPDAATDRAPPRHVARTPAQRAGAAAAAARRVSARTEELLGRSSQTRDHRGGLLHGDPEAARRLGDMAVIGVASAEREEAGLIGCRRSRATHWPAHGLRSRFGPWPNGIAVAAADRGDTAPTPARKWFWHASATTWGSSVRASSGLGRSARPERFGQLTVQPALAWQRTVAVSASMVTDWARAARDQPRPTPPSAVSVSEISASSTTAML